MLTTAGTVQCGVVHASVGTRSSAATSEPALTITTSRATASDTGTAQRRETRCMTSHASTTGPTYAGESASPTTGSRQIGSSTPASIARASDAGIRAIRSPRAGTRPVSTISTPVTTNAPTAASQPPVTAPVESSSAAPGVDQARVIG